MKYYEGIDYFVRYVQFPNMASPAFAASNGDGTFDIYINTLFCPVKQRENLAHEIKHLTEEHFYRDDLSITQIERSAGGFSDTESVPEPAETPRRLQDAFEGHPEDGMIPVFHSLESLRHYMFAMREQRVRDAQLSHSQT